MDFDRALQRTDADFESILEIMKLRKDPWEIESVRNLLLTVNKIIDYYINRDEDSLKISVAYFPIVNDYAQELCEDFVVLKMGFYTNHEWKNFIRENYERMDSLYIPSDVRTKKQRQEAKDNYEYEKELGKILSRSKDDRYDYGKTIIYSENLWKQYNEYLDSNKSYNRKTVNKYWYLSKAVESFSNYCHGLCPLIFTPGRFENLYNLVIGKGKESHLDNIVIFPMRTADGRYTDYCSEAFQKPFFDDFIASQSGLRNVFFFCFSRKPYRLRRLFDFKQRMKERINISNDDSFDFISFTYKESLILNSRDENKLYKIALGKDSDDLQQDYEVLFDDITSGLERSVARRNEVSLCITKASTEEYCSQLLIETEADENLLKEIFKINEGLWSTDVDIKIHHFVCFSSIMVITGNDVSQTLKELFKQYLMTKHLAKSVKFGTFGDLRGNQVGGEYKNNIKQNKILVVSFRNDYTESIYHKYPNSFDPYCLNSDQMLMEIRNFYFMRQYYEWGMYNYGKALRKILKSDFRTSEMKPILKNYKKPIKKLPEDTRDEMERNSSRVQQVKVVYADNTVRMYGRSDWMLYKHGNTIGILPLSDLIDVYESLDDLYLQPLMPLVKAVCKDFIDSEKEKDTRSEKLFKEQTSYGLTQQEINSNLQLWKILLIRRIKNLSDKLVYSEIMSHFNERDKISFQSFKKWTNIDYGIPRARKMQKYLVENYLGIRPPYINLIRRIKERTKSDTESITISVRHFLNIALLNKSTTAFDLLSPEIQDLLDINKPEDIDIIINRIKNNIYFEQIKSIQQ